MRGIPDLCHISIFSRKSNSACVERPRRKPFTQWVKNLTSRNNKEKSSTPKPKKSQTHNGSLKNNPYPKSGNHLQEQQRPSLGSSADGSLSFFQNPNGSQGSLPTSAMQERETHGNSNRSGAPTLATKAETVHSDAGHSKAATTTTHGGALSSMDGAGADSTFSSPTQSQHSLTTTLTTIQSTGVGNTLQSASHPHSDQHGLLNNPNPGVMFSHQYPVSPAPGTPGADRISAIPRHVADTLPNTYNSATANNLLTDNASILTLASSSKRRRRSMDTDASVRALAPSSVWGGSRESLPLSVLSGNAEASTTPGAYSIGQSRPSIGGLASTERASVYSSQGVGLASERNSLISHRAPTKDLADAKSMRSITVGDKADSKSLGGDVGSLRGYEGSMRNEGSMRSGKVGHSRSDSIPGSIGTPLASARPGQGFGGLSRRSSDWAEVDDREEDDEDNDESRSKHVEDEDEAKQGIEEHERAEKEEKEANDERLGEGDGM